MVCSLSMFYLLSVSVVSCGLRSFICTFLFLACADVCPFIHLVLHSLGGLNRNKVFVQSSTAHSAQPRAEESQVLASLAR
ncbi:Uncharacterized protein HZ326_12347 [Fusarium oxysporum f. sp. albedinis]|nr:Uncharacterized protein HZ326_12347 [Fusarium oxysporum f. sp. albedinis]